MDAALAQQRVNFPSVAADVVFPEDVHVELGHVRLVVQADDVFEHAVVGDVVAGGLAHPFVALATERHDVDAQFLLHLPRHRMDVVADEADRTGGENGNRLGLENLVRLADGLLNFFSPPNTIWSSCMSVFMQYCR